MQKPSAGPLLSFGVRLVLLVLLSQHRGLYAQTHPIRLEGGITLSTDYNSTSGPSPSRQSSISRALLRPTIVLFDQIVLPFEISYSTQGQEFRQPFNQFGVSPRLWGWLTLHAGYFSTRLSDLTFGDTRLLGGGVEVKTSAFRFAFLYGVSQRALSPDSSIGVRGEFKRTTMAARVGVGNENAVHFDISFLRAVDDSGSISISPAILTPKENAVLAAGMGFPLFTSAVRFSVEVGASAFTNDTRAPEVTGSPQWVKQIFIPRLSSQIDGAAKASLRITLSRSFSLSLAGRWVGPGYVTLGYTQLPSDVFEWSAAPVVRLFENRLLLRSSVGVRVNNLRKNHLASTKRVIINAGGTVQPSTSFSFDVQYLNHDMHSRPRVDSLGISNVTQSLSLSPRYTFASLGGTNTIAVTYSSQSFSDLNAASGNTSSHSVGSGSAAWTLSFPSSFSFTASLSHTSSASQAFSTKMTSFNGTAARAFFNNAFRASIALGYTTTASVTRHGQLHGSVRASHSLGAFGSFTLMVSTYNSHYGAGGGESTSTLLSSLQYSCAF